MSCAKGKLIAIEGVDGSGKATQSSMIYERLKNEGVKVKKVEYPRYENKSSILVRMYLNGEFGGEAKETNPYVASTFYAADRYASYKQEYEDLYKQGGIVIADRYTTANMIHQASKIDDLDEKQKFLDWLWELEFNLYKIPIPDIVFFLDIPLEYNQELINNRENKDPRRKAKDIHEKDIEYLKASYNNALDLVDKYNWTRINCIKNNKIRTTHDIHEQIYKIVNEKLLN